MIEIQPNTLYNVEDLAEISGITISSVYPLLKKMRRNRGLGGYHVTGREILNYFENMEPEEQQPENKGSLSPETIQKLKNMGIDV